eukprot:TRINITY_DN19974_c0_g1_i2.p1 TRINITY_DN19974_c0_g1~~TRINITY_DN19974_c0_g1_i2.p1  ORF type:complete len:183 (-),score=14.14 TRINITY_DN19974_c0_g1_i2:503-1018(-)
MVIAGGSGCAADYISSGRPPEADAQDNTLHGSFPFEPPGLATQGVGHYCQVRKLKPGDLGCAMVSCPSGAVREAVMQHVEHFHPGSVTASIHMLGMPVTLQRQVEAHANTDVHTDIYVCWGHRVEKATPVPAAKLAQEFDYIIRNAIASLSWSSLAPEPMSLPICRFRRLQ